MDPRVDNFHAFCEQEERMTKAGEKNAADGPFLRPSKRVGAGQLFETARPPRVKEVFLLQGVRPFTSD
jgi:hypothetical protein